MIKCRYCGTELPDDAVFCDNCGKRVVIVEEEPVRETIRPVAKNYRHKKRLPALVIVMIVIVVLMLVFVAIGKLYYYNSWDDPYDDLPRITAEEYNSIELGMKYEDVTKALESKGYEYYKDTYDHTTTYRWPGELYDEIYTYCEFVFDKDNVLTSKCEYNIFDGEKVAEDQDNVATVIDYETADRIRKGMSLAEVEELYGGPGTLHSSRSDSSGRIIRSYRWNIRGEDDVEDADYDWYYKNYIMIDINENDMVAFWEIW